MKINLLALFLTVVSGGIMYGQDTDHGNKDFYTRIASMGQGRETVRPMESIEERVLPIEKKLKWDDSRKYSFKKMNKIDSEEKMHKALNQLREEHTPYLCDLAPALETGRIESRIEQMQFRYETDADRNDFEHLLQGKGRWENVKMPYYHGPQGPSTAWYRSEIEFTDSMLKRPSLMIHFNGSDYYTDVFINGHHVGSHEGMLDEFEFNLRPYAKSGKNILLVKVRNDYSLLGGEGEPRRWGNKLSASNSPGWDDPFSGWSCCPTGYGIYQDVYIIAKGSPYITDLFCRPLLDEKKVELWTEIDLENGDEAEDFELKISLYGQNFPATITKNQKNKVSVVGGRVLHKTTLAIPDSLFRMWSPDSPWLYQMQVSLFDKTGRQLLDGRKQQFGMRSFVINQQSTPKGRMYLNGEEIRLRGANTMGFFQRAVMAHDWERLKDDLLLAKLTNMNFIRTTQRIMPKEVYEYADRLGVMMQADLPLFAYVNQKQFPEIIRQSSGIERVLRNHPSVIMLSYLNEPMAEIKPHAISRQAYENLFEALDITVHNENPDRAVKYVDGDYQAPNNGYPDNHCYNIWYDNHGVGLKEMCRGEWLSVSKGWMFGCGEFGAEGLDPVSLMERRYPKEWLATEADGTWNPRKMRGIYSGEQTYGKHWDWFETEYTKEDWVEASQQHQKWGVAKVTRAFRRMPRMNSFAVHLFIDAWPNGWMKALMDVERTPKQAWFSYRDALTPLCVQVESERHAFYSGEEYPFEVWICNDTHKQDKLQLRYQLEQNGRILNTGMQHAEIPYISTAVSFQGFLPVKMPDVRKEESLSLRVILYDPVTDKTIHEESCQFRVYPLMRPPSRTIALSALHADATHLFEVFQIDSSVPLSGNWVKNTIVITEKPDKDKLEDLRDSVRQGLKVVFLNSAIDSQNLQHAFSYILEKPMSSWILCRNRDHNYISGTDKRDLFYPFSSISQSPERYRFRSMQGEKIVPILTHGKQVVVGQINEGKGSWILCGLSLEGMLDTNPVLSQIFWNILN